MILNGVVEGLNDPKQLGRVQVRIRGFHSADKTLMPTEALPWCRFLTPIDGGGIYGTKSAPILGASVYLLDLGNGIEFLIIGGVQTEVKVKPNTELGFRDPSGRFPKESDLNHSTNPLVEQPASHPNQNNISYPGTANTAPKSTVISGVKYPYNNVYYDQQENIIEIDASEQAPRIRIQHSSGSKIEFDAQGNIVITGTKEINISGSKVGNSAGTNFDVETATTTNNSTTATNYTTPIFTINGDLQVNGTVHGSSTITADASLNAPIINGTGTGGVINVPNVKATNSIDINGLELSTHRHTEHDGQDTGTPHA